MNEIGIGTISLFLWIILIILLIFINLIRGKEKWHIRKQDGLLEILLWISFFSVPFAYQMSDQFDNIFFFFIAFAFAGTYLEFLGGWTWYKLMGTRLYRYYKKNILGFTSIYMPPLWGAAGMFFLSIYNRLNLQEIEIDIFEFVSVFSLFGLIGILISMSIMALSDLFTKKVNGLKGFTWLEYSLFVNFLWTGIIATAVYFNNINILIYFVITSSVGMILEGLLGKGIHKIFGENFWIYRRFALFRGGTSLLILPIWSIASLLALIFIELILY